MHSFCSQLSQLAPLAYSCRPMLATDTAWAAEIIEFEIGGQPAEITIRKMVRAVLCNAAAVRAGAIVSTLAERAHASCLLGRPEQTVAEPGVGRRRHAQPRVRPRPTAPQAALMAGC